MIETAVTWTSEWGWIITLISIVMLLSATVATNRERKMLAVRNKELDRIYEESKELNSAWDVLADEADNFVGMSSRVTERIMDTGGCKGCAVGLIETAQAAALDVRRFQRMGWSSRPGDQRTIWE